MAGLWLHKAEICIISHLTTHPLSTLPGVSWDRASRHNILAGSSTTQHKPQGINIFPHRQQSGNQSDKGVFLSPDN